MNEKSHKVTSPEKGHEDSNKTDEIHKAALVAGIVLPDDKETSTVTETDTNAPPQAPLESSDSDDTALVPLPNPETIPSRHTKHVHFADVEPDSEPNLLDMVPPSPHHLFSQDLCGLIPMCNPLCLSIPCCANRKLRNQLHCPQWNHTHRHSTVAKENHFSTHRILCLTLASLQTLLDTMLHDEETPGTPTVEENSPFSMPVFHVSPPSETSQTVITTADIHARAEELNTPVITPLGTPVSPFPDSDDLTETLLDVTKTEYVDADSATEDVPLSPYVHISSCY